MPTLESCGLATNADSRGRASEVLVDTSVAVSLVLADHEAHADTVGAVKGLRLGLAGHAWFETYSVLTRLPPGSRRSPAVVGAIMKANFPASRFLTRRQAAGLAAQVADLGIAGGAVYDALVGAAARAHGLVLLSRDVRARTTYESLGVDVRMIGQR